MGLTSQLIPALVCLLVCTSNVLHGHNDDIILKEIIKTLNILTARKDPQFMELSVADVLTAPKNTTEKEIFCRAAVALRQVYLHHRGLPRMPLRSLDKNLYSMAGKIPCSVNEAKKSSLKDFLERLKRIMQEKYAKG